MTYTDLSKDILTKYKAARFADERQALLGQAVLLIMEVLAAMADREPTRPVLSLKKR